jgi:hypothetical protein
MGPQASITDVLLGCKDRKAFEADQAPQTHADKGSQKMFIKSSSSGLGVWFS